VLFRPAAGELLRRDGICNRFTLMSGTSRALVHRNCVRLQTGSKLINLVVSDDRHVVSTDRVLARTGGRRLFLILTMTDRYCERKDVTRSRRTQFNDSTFQFCYCGNEFKLSLSLPSTMPVGTQLR
jgi:hypothetical protein